MSELFPLDSLPKERFETPNILRKVANAGRKLAELKGVAQTIPNQGILISTLGLQEAKDSSEIENIVTTHDELFKGGFFAENISSPAAKEVRNYQEALFIGFQSVLRTGLLTNNDILDIQAALEGNRAGFRKLPGTELKNNLGQTVYIPPQNREDIERHMRHLERFINEDIYDADPLIKMALIHHQFETIHPFYDGNGRTGRILNVLYLVKEHLLDIPVLYHSSYVVRTKNDYYRLLQEVREKDNWEEWVLYMLDAIEQTSGNTIEKINAIRTSLLQAKHEIRRNHKFYSQDLINNLFTYPYTKIEFVQRDLKVSRLTATNYLDALSDAGILHKHRQGRYNYYINHVLVDILVKSD